MKLLRRVDHEARANQGHVWQIKLDGEWREIRFQTSVEAWAFIGGWRQRSIDAER